MCVCVCVCVCVLGVLGVFSVCLAAVNSAPHGQRLESTLKKKKNKKKKNKSLQSFPVYISCDTLLE